MGAPWRKKGFTWCRSTHLACTVPLWAPLLSCWQHAPLRLPQLSIRKENKTAEAHLFLVCNWWWERSLPLKLWPSCKFTAGLQLSAGQFTNNYLNHLTHAVSPASSGCHVRPVLWYRQDPDFLSDSYCIRYARLHFSV